MTVMDVKELIANTTLQQVLLLMNVGVDSELATDPCRDSYIVNIVKGVTIVCTATMHLAVIEHIPN